MVFGLVSLLTFPVTTPGILASTPIGISYLQSKERVKGRVKRASQKVNRASREKVEGGTREEQGKGFSKETETGGLKRCEEGVRGGREGKMGRRKDGLCIPGPVFFYNRPSYTLQGRFPV